MAGPDRDRVRVGIALVRRGDRFLIRRRPVGTAMAGYWEFPGGKCEPGESAEAALIHESLHSLGLGENPPTSSEITSRVISRCRG